jgi:SAM-dependent methyltransferase
VPAGLSETRRLVAPILSRAGIVDQRAYLWTASELEWLALTLGVTPRRDPARRPRLLDLGCGWGSLGIALARRVDDLRVEGVDLDPELLAAGRLIVQALELRDRVHLREDDLTQLDREALVSFDAVTCQAVLVHLPRAESWLSGLVAGLQAGTVVALVEVDALARARGIRDSVTDDDPEYAALRREVAAAVVEGAQHDLGVDRRIGGRLGVVLGAVSLGEIQGGPVASDALLRPPYRADDPRALWFADRLRCRRGGDPVERMLAVAGGMSVDRFDRWEERRRRADDRRLGQLSAGCYARDEREGTFWARGVVNPAR